MEIVSTPHLPDKNVKTILCGEHRALKEITKKMGVETITVTDDRRLPYPICNHSDIQCCHVGKGKIFTSNVSFNDLDNYSVELIKETPTDLYPGDCLLNCFSINEVLITGKHCSASVLNYAQENSAEIKFVNQGYAKCSAAIVSEDAVITADKSIALALLNHCNVLFIEQGHILLEGYNYGFIGGTCGKLSSDKLCFMGNPHNHPDGRKIVSFTEENNCEVISLCNGELIDFGGFIPLYQE